MTRAEMIVFERKIEAAIVDHFKRDDIHVYSEREVGDKMVGTNNGFSATRLSEHLAYELTR